MRTCAIVNCVSGDYKLCRWRKTICEVHGCKKSVAPCVCPAPFELFTFPKEESLRLEWTKLVNRKAVNGRNWTPSAHHRICSHHFHGGRPTETNPLPSLELGYAVQIKKRRLPPKPRQHLSPKRIKLDVGSGAESLVGIVQDNPGSITQDPSDDIDSILREVIDYTVHNNCNGTSNPLDDHSYSATPSVGNNGNCSNCCAKDQVILQLKKKIQALEIAICHNACKTERQSITVDVCEQFIETDALVRKNTGLQSVGSLNALCNFVKPKAEKMRYWRGSKSSLKSRIKRKLKSNCKTVQSTPRKRGFGRRLSVKSELVLVLMKLRLGLPNAFLAGLFKIAVGSCSSIFNTWVKLLSQELKGLVSWPDKQVIRALMPKSLAKKYPSLRCTIDCSETFIHRPRDLYLQAATWSDYKHHNTLKYLVAIAPNGHISFISQAWGGRATDRFIVQQSRLLDLIDPGDVILADRGFTIQDDLLFRQANLVIPPSGSGKVQMTRENVLKTRKIANARIHVERAINRLKWFRILSSVLPLSLVPLFDDILIITAALCNLLPPLVK